MSSFFGGEFGDHAQPISRTDLLLPPPITRGKYRDWQGDLYDVMHVVRDVHEGQWLVLYRSLVDVQQPMMVMSYARFFGTVDTGAYRPVPRFSHVVDYRHPETSPIPPPLPRAADSKDPGAPAAPATSTRDERDAAGATPQHGQAAAGSGGEAESQDYPTITTDVASMDGMEDILPTRRPAPRAPKSAAFQRFQEALAAKAAASNSPKAP